MKPPVREIMTPTSLTPEEDLLQQYEMLKDWIMQTKETLERGFGIPGTLRYRVSEDIPFRDESQNEGWFTVRGVSSPVECALCTREDGIGAAQLLGVLKIKSLFFSRNFGCVSCSRCGAYTKLPTNFILMALDEICSENEVPFSSRAVADLTRG